MVSKPANWRKDLSTVEAAISACAGTGKHTGGPGTDSDEFIVAVKGLRRVLEDGVADDGVANLGRMEILGHLAAGVAHELNNWLFVIKGFSELTRLDLPDDDPLTESFDDIDEAIDRAEGLTRMVLECAHPSGDGNVSVYLHPLVKSAVKWVCESLPNEIAVCRKIATDVPPVTADPIRLFPVVTALLQMAAEPLAAENGLMGVTLADMTGKEWSGGSSLVLRVGSTTGADAEEVWRRLQLGGGSPASPPPENEAAVSSISGIIQSWGGELRFRSIDRRGSCFEVVLPTTLNPPVR